MRMTLRGNDREGLEMGKRVTLKDIAQAANVTTATVSYVINDTPRAEDRARDP